MLRPVNPGRMDMQNQVFIMTPSRCRGFHGYGPRKINR